MLTAFGIAGVMTALRPRTALAVTVAALLLQWGDVSYMRGRIAEIVHNPAPSEFGSQAAAQRVYDEIAARGRLVVLPTFYCRPDPMAGRNRDVDIADVEAEFMAARANVDVWHPKGSRPAFGCTADRDEDVARLVGHGVLIDFPIEGPEDRTADVRRELSCWQANVAWVCTAKAATVH